MSKIMKGQKIWIWINKKNGSNIIETTVKSAGTKYITTDYGIKYDSNTLCEVDYKGVPSFIILDLDKYNSEQDYKIKINKIKNIDWECIEKEDFDKIYDILRDYD